MNRHWSIYAIALFAAAVLAPDLAASQDMRSVKGTVSDSSGRPVPYVNIDGGPRYRSVTNASGEFTLKLPAKEAMEVAVRRIGFLPAKFKVEPGGDTTVAIQLQQLGVMLNAQVVRAQQQMRSLEFRGFYERMLQREQGALVGEFVTPEEIEMRNPQRVTQLFEQRSGIHVRREGRCQVIVQCFRVLGTGGCAATVYLDGQRLNRLQDAAATGSSAAPPIDELITVSSVAAIEIYPRGSSVPPKYQSFAGTCAVVVIWTR